LPLAQYVLTRHLREDESEGLLVLKDVARNLFRRNTLQGVLYRHLHKHQAPLRFLYTLLANPAMEEYLLVPLTDQAWDQYRSVRAVFLGELALRPVEATQHPRFRRSARWLNLHRRRPTPLTRFAGMLYDLLETPKRENEEIDLAAYREMYTGVADYPDGKEIALSYETMTTFLSYQTLAEVAEAPKIGSHLAQNISPSNAIRPAVLTALIRLGEVAADIRAYSRADNRQAQLAAIARTTADLNEITADVSNSIIAPEQYLLKRIIAQWQQLILDAIGTLGKTAPVPDTQLRFPFENGTASSANAASHPDLAPLSSPTHLETPSNQRTS
jgi:hypothetical protein